MLQGDSLGCSRNRDWTLQSGCVRSCAAQYLQMRGDKRSKKLLTLPIAPNSIENSTRVFENFSGDGRIQRATCGSGSSKSAKRILKRLRLTVIRNDIGRILADTKAISRKKISLLLSQLDDDVFHLSLFLRKCAMRT